MHMAQADDSHMQAVEQPRFEQLTNAAEDEERRMAESEAEMAELREMLGRGSPSHVRGHIRSKDAMPLGVFVKLEVAYQNQQIAADTRQRKEEARQALEEHQRAERERHAYWKASASTQHVEAKARVEELKVENARDIARQKAAWASQRKEQRQHELDEKRQASAPPSP